MLPQPSKINLLNLITSQQHFLCLVRASVKVCTRAQRCLLDKDVHCTNMRFFNTSSFACKCGTRNNVLDVFSLRLKLCKQHVCYLSEGGKGLT